MSAGKIAVLVLWAVLGASFFLPAGGALASVGRALFWITLVAHVVECVVFSGRLRAAGGSLPSHVFQTLVFGLFHVRELPRPVAS